MEKLKIIFVCLILLPFVSACYEIREEVDIKKDGSGTYALILDLSQSKAMLEMAMAMPDNQGKIPFAELDSSFAKGTARFKNMPGISQVQPLNNRQEYVFGMKFDFKDVTALNLALQRATNDQGPTDPVTSPTPQIYKFTKRTLERTGDFFLKGLTDMSSLTADNTENAEQIKDLLKRASYVCLIRTEGKIKKFTNPKAELSYTAKEVRFSANLLDLLEDRANCANTVKFK